jgi:NAD(P)-dependent dehydrogenase (short-subunit alcohol dehydrogenase family)
MSTTVTTIAGTTVLTDERVTPLVLDISDAGQIADAAEQAAELDILINNAGVSDPAPRPVPGGRARR